MNTYEGLFIFQDALKEEGVEAALKDVREEIEKFEGRVDNIVRLGRRAFARIQSDKHKGGHFVVMDIALKPENMQPLRARLKLKGDVFRSQFIRLENPAPAPVAAEEAEHVVA